MRNAMMCDNLSVEDALIIYQMAERKEVLKEFTFPARPSSDGFYHIQVKDNRTKSGRKQYKAKTLEELEEKVYKHEKGIQGKCKKCFKDVFLIAQDEKLSLVKNKEKKLSVMNTIGRAKCEYRRFFADTAFEKKLIDQISKSDIEKIILANLKKYDLRKKGFASMRAILKGVFDLAYNEYWIDDNPYTRIDFKKYSDMLLQAVPLERRVHSDDEMANILNQVQMSKCKKPKYIPAYALEMQILTGMRRGELPPLMWSDVRDGYIFIHQELITVKRNNGVPEHFVIVSHTKTWTDRKFPITDELHEFLTQLRAVHEKYYPESPFLFPADTPNGCITNNHVYGFYRRTCKKLNIEISREFMKGTHSFRRNAITDVVNATNGNLIMASQLFGNSPDVARQNYYTGTDLAIATEVLNQRKISKQMVNKSKQ